MMHFQQSFSILHQLASCNNLSIKIIVNFKLSFDKRYGLSMYIFYFHRKQDSKCSITQAVLNMWPPKSLRIEEKTKIVHGRIMGQNFKAVYQLATLYW